MPVFWSKKWQMEAGTRAEMGVPISAEKKQTTRQLKAEAKCCGYIIRLTKKWSEIGMPSCPCGNEFVLEGQV